MDVLAEGSQWLGRRSLRPPSFHNQFGVWPATAFMLHSLVPAAGTMEHLLRVLWWLKTYPTEEEIRNYGISPTHFRAELWATIRILNKELPEVISNNLFVSHS